MLEDFDPSTVRGNPALAFDDTKIAPYGQKLLGNHEFALLAGEASPALGYVSPGHNSAYFDAATGKYFIIFHTRFPGRGEQHELRVHELLFNEDGWPVMAPLRYVATSLSTTPVAAVPLTSVRQPAVHMGALAADLLLEEIEAADDPGRAHEHRRVVLQPELVVRGSSLGAR